MESGIEDPFSKDNNTPANGKVAKEAPKMPEGESATTTKGDKNAERPSPGSSRPTPAAISVSKHSDRPIDEPSAIRKPSLPPLLEVLPETFPLKEQRVAWEMAKVEDVADEGEPLTSTCQTPASPKSTSHRAAMKRPMPPASASMSAPNEQEPEFAAMLTPHHSLNGGPSGSTMAQRPSTFNQSLLPEQAQFPPRRPSALDYLVTPSPSATPRVTAPETIMHPRPHGGTSHVSGFSNMSAPPGLYNPGRGLHHSNGMAPPGLDGRPWPKWSTSYAGSVSAQAGSSHAGQAYQRPNAMSEMYGNPAASVANETIQGPSPSVLQSTYGPEAPMSGYQLLAAKLVGGMGGPPVAPMYRRFEALNHRLLLYMQTDLLELERELRMLDTKDTVERGYGAIPASRRHERWTNNALSQQRTEILGQIGYKLCQYNKIMTSFTKMRSLAVPSPAEVHEYRAYLANSRLISDEDAQFLSQPEDLLVLAASPPPAPTKHQELNSHAPNTSAGPPTATEAASPPPHRKESGPRPRRTSSNARSSTPARRHNSLTDEARLSDLAAAMFVAVFVPVVTFAIIPDFAGRITVVALVGTGVWTALMQSGLVRLLGWGATNWLSLAMAYGAAMGVIGWIVK